MQDLVGGNFFFIEFYPKILILLSSLYKKTKFGMGNFFWKDTRDKVEVTH